MLKFKLVTRPLPTTNNPNPSSSPNPLPPLVVAAAPIRIKSRRLRILDFDCEARPLHWIGGDYVSKEITAIAWAWTDEPEDVSCYLLGEVEPKEMLARFVEAFKKADMVTGHFIRGYDLPMVNGALTEYLMPSLTKIMTHDTKLDFIRRQGLSSSQENIGSMLKLHHPKVKMDQALWRDANRLTPEGLEKTRARVIGDVRQHIEMRAKLLELGYLGPPVEWKPGAAPVESYTP